MMMMMKPTRTWYLGRLYEACNYLRKNHKLHSGKGLIKIRIVQFDPAETFNVHAEHSCNHGMSDSIKFSFSLQDQKEW